MFIIIIILMDLGQVPCSYSTPFSIVRRIFCSWSALKSHYGSRPTIIVFHSVNIIQPFLSVFPRFITKRIWASFWYLSNITHMILLGASHTPWCFHCTLAIKSPPEIVMTIHSVSVKPNQYRNKYLIETWNWIHPTQDEITPKTYSIRREKEHSSGNNR